MTLVGLLIGILIQSPPNPPRTDLGLVMETARTAFISREFAPLFDQRRPVRLELPDQPAAVSVRGRVAAAALQSLVRRTEDVGLTTVSAEVVSPGHGYLELIRRYRVAGTQEDHAHRILISVRFEENRWQITEVWVASADQPSIR